MKIPTYKPQNQMTTQSPNVESNIQIDPSQNIYRATKSITNFLTDEYIKEAKLEADNKATLALNELFINQSDGTKGLYSIQAETKTNGKPLEAAKNFDGNVNKLWDYAKKNKLQDFDNFTKKALEKKFYATSGLFKAKGLAGSRQQQLVDTKKITNDVVLKESLALVLNGVEYLPIYKSVIEDRLSKDPTITNTGVYKQELNTAVIFGETQLATNLATTNPYQLKDNINKFKNLTIEQKSKLLLAADETIKEQKFNILLQPLNTSLDADPRDFTLANEAIKNKTFGNNKELQNIFNSLSPQDKIEFEKSYQTKAKAVRSDRNLAILTQREVTKVQVAQESKTIFDNMEKNKGTYNKDLERIFGVNTSQVEQFSTMNQKIADGSANKLSNFEKNDDIIKLIINNKVNTITDKFLLTGENGDGKSILERIGSETTITDVKYLNNLLEISTQPKFKENHTAFFKFIDNFKDQVAGSVALQPLDKSKDARLNQFKYTMYNRYIQGLEAGINSDQLLKATKGNKNFIGYDFYTFLPNANDVFKSIRDEIQTNTNVVVEEGLTLRQQKEKELGKKITAQEYLNLTKEQ